MSSSYDGNDAEQRLKDIAERFALIREFIEDISREQFLEDKKTQYAVVRALEEICEAAYWFTKHENGAALRAENPNVNFMRFGTAGNIFRHQYGVVRYDIVWDDILYGPDVAALEQLLVNELPSYQKQLSKKRARGAD